MVCGTPELSPLAYNLAEGRSCIGGGFLRLQLARPQAGLRGASCRADAARLARPPTTRGTQSLTGVFIGDTLPTGGVSND